MKKGTTDRGPPRESLQFEDEEVSDPPVDYGPEPVFRGNVHAVITILLLILCMLGDVAGVGNSLIRYQLAGEALNGADPEAEENLEASDTSMAVIGVGQCGVYLFAVVAFCLWFYRAYANLVAFHVPNLQYSPGWAVGYFFIPFLNLYRPYQVTQEIWKASDPNPSDYWKRGRGSALVGAWWGVWILGNIVNNIVMRASLKDDPGLQEIQGIAIGSIIGDSLTFFAALLLIFVILSIKKRQQEKFKSMLLGVGDEPEHADGDD